MIFFFFLFLYVHSLTIVVFRETDNEYVVEVNKEEYVNMLRNSTSIAQWYRVITTNPFGLSDVQVDYFGNVILVGEIDTILYSVNEGGQGLHSFHPDDKSRSIGLTVIPAQFEELTVYSVYSKPTNCFDSFVKENSISVEEYEITSPYYVSTSCFFEEIDYFREVSFSDTSTRQLKYESPVCNLLLTGSFIIRQTSETHGLMEIHNAAIYSPDAQRWFPVATEIPTDTGEFNEPFVVGFSKLVLGGVYYHGWVWNEDDQKVEHSVVFTNYTVDYFEEESRVFEEYFFEIPQIVLPLKSVQINIEASSVWINPKINGIQAFTMPFDPNMRFVAIWGVFDGFSSMNCTHFCIVRVDSNNPSQHFIAPLGPDVSTSNEVISAKVFYDDVHPYVIMLTVKPRVDLVNPGIDFTLVLWDLTNKRIVSILLIDLPDIFSATNIEVIDDHVIMIYQSQDDENSKCAEYFLDIHGGQIVKMDRSFCFETVNAVLFKSLSAPILYSDNFPNTEKLRENAPLKVVGHQAWSSDYEYICKFDQKSVVSERLIIFFNESSQNETTIPSNHEILCKVPKSYTSSYPPKNFDIEVKSKFFDLSFTRNLQFYGENGESLNSVLRRSEYDYTYIENMETGRLVVIFGIVALILWIVLFIIFAFPCSLKIFEENKREILGRIYFMLLPQQKIDHVVHDKVLKEKIPDNIQNLEFLLGIFVSLSLLIVFLFAFAYTLEGEWNSYKMDLEETVMEDSSLLKNLRTFPVYFDDPGEMKLKKYHSSFTSTSENTFFVKKGNRNVRLIFPVLQDNEHSILELREEKYLFGHEDTHVVIGFEENFMNTVSEMLLEISWLKISNVENSVGTKIAAHFSEISQRWFPALNEFTNLESSKYVVKVDELKIMKRSQTGSMCKITMNLSDKLYEKEFSTMSPFTQILLFFTLLGSTIALRGALSKTAFNISRFFIHLGIDNFLMLIIIISLYVLAIVQIVLNATDQYQIINDWKVPIVSSSLACICCCFMMIWSANFFKFMRRIECTPDFWKKKIFEPFWRLKFYWVNGGKKKYALLGFIPVFFVCLAYSIASLMVNFVIIMMIVRNINLEEELFTYDMENVPESVHQKIKKYYKYSENSGSVAATFFVLDTVFLLFSFLVILIWKLLKLKVLGEEFDYQFHSIKKKMEISPDDIADTELEDKGEELKSILVEEIEVKNQELDSNEVDSLPKFKEQLESVTEEEEEEELETTEDVEESGEQINEGKLSTSDGETESEVEK